jgi:hypothetical protein
MKVIFNRLATRERGIAAGHADGQLLYGFTLRCVLTNLTDKPIAIAGIAKDLQSHMQCPYFSSLED